ncbi:MAG: AsmA family protein, partial [Candidatus Omnitrophica bacterium]|nr:AsmA family protein [Candidatus Omnitrophota bacterium]
MKIIKVILVSLVVIVVVAVVGLIIFIKTFDVMKYKPQIVEQAQAALGRSVDFEKAALGISLRQGISVKINNLSVAEDPKFAKGDFLTVKEVSLGLDALGLLQNKVNIPSVIIDSARVSIIRDKDGAINAAAIAQPKKEESAPAAPVSPQSRTDGPSLFAAVAYARQPAIPAPALPAVNIASLQVMNSTVVYLDRMFEPALSVEVTDFDAQVRGFSLDRQFSFTARAAVLSRKQNINVIGSAQLAMKTNSVT